VTFLIVAGCCLLYLVIGLGIGRYLYGANRAGAIDLYAELGVPDPVDEYEREDHDFDHGLCRACVFVWPVALAVLGIVALAAFGSWVVQGSRRRSAFEKDEAVARQEKRDAAMQDMGIHDQGGEIFGKSE
jgi:hypothetical protein